jgi:hypothetical protein
MAKYSNGELELARLPHGRILVKEYYWNGEIWRLKTECPKGVSCGFLTYDGEKFERPIKDNIWIYFKEYFFFLAPLFSLFLVFKVKRYYGFAFGISVAPTVFILQMARLWNIPEFISIVLFYLFFPAVLIGLFVSELIKLSVSGEVLLFVMIVFNGLIWEAVLRLFKKGGRLSNEPL